MSKASSKLELLLPGGRWLPVARQRYADARASLERTFAQLVDTVRNRSWQHEVERLGAEVQRFGEQAWQTIAARWPALAELVRENKIVSTRFRPAPPVAPSPPLSRDAIEALLAQLNASPDWEMRRSAASSLGHVEAEGVVAALVHSLRDSSVEVAVSAVDALGQHHEPDSTTALISVLKNADGYFSPVTRVAAIAGLARRLGADQLDPLFGAMRDLDAEVSIAAIAVITERVPALARDSLLPILRDRSGYFLPVVRLAAANALENSGTLQESLAVELAQSETDPAVQRVLERAQHVLGREPAVT